MLFIANESNAMSRSAQILQQDISTPSVGQWMKTDCYLHSVEATLEPGSTSATVDVYVSNSSHGTGVKIATLTLSASTASDGFSLPNEDKGWAFVRSQVVAVVGVVKSVTACVGG